MRATGPTNVIVTIMTKQKKQVLCWHLLYSLCPLIDWCRHFVWSISQEEPLPRSSAELMDRTCFKAYVKVNCMCLPSLGDSELYKVESFPLYGSLQHSNNVDIFQAALKVKSIWIRP